MGPLRCALILACLVASGLACGDSAEEDGFVILRDDGGADDAGGPLADAGPPPDADLDAAPEPPVDAAVDTGPPEPIDAGPEPIDPCPVYCERALANCTGSNALFADEEACLAACAPMPPGDEGDTTGNSAWCRAHHAGLAADTPGTSCGVASESGDHVCGTPCEAYCDQVLAYCTGDLEAFSDRVACLEVCADYPDGAWYDTTGDTVQCRTYHARLAADDPAMHCMPAGESGFGACF